MHDGRAFRLWYDGLPISLLNPATDASGRTSDYVSLYNCHKAFVVCHVTQGSATPVEWSVLMATDDNGTNSAAVYNNVPIAANENVGASDVIVDQAAGTSYTNTDTEETKLVIFEIEPTWAFNLNNLPTNSNALPFTHIAVQTAASSASNITSAMLYLLPLRNSANPVPSTTGV